MRLKCSCFPTGATAKLKIVPIAIGTRDFDVLRGLGGALAEAVADLEESGGKKR